MSKAIVFDFNRTLYDPDNDMLMPGALDILLWLYKQNIPLFLVCKGDEERRRKIELLGLEHFFENIIVTERKGPENFMECKQRHPERKYFVIGDRLEEEIRHGLACGMTAIWFRNGKFAHEIPSDIQPHYTISSLRELQDNSFPAWQ